MASNCPHLIGPARNSRHPSKNPTAGRLVDDYATPAHPRSTTGTNCPRIPRGPPTIDHRAPAVHGRRPLQLRSAPPTSDNVPQHLRPDPPRQPFPATLDRSTHYAPTAPPHYAPTAPTHYAPTAPTHYAPTARSHPHPLTSQSARHPGPTSRYLRKTTVAGVTRRDRADDRHLRVARTRVAREDRRPRPTTSGIRGRSHVRIRGFENDGGPRRLRSQSRGGRGEERSHGRFPAGQSANRAVLELARASRECSHLRLATATRRRPESAFRGRLQQCRRVRGGSRAAPTIELINQ